MKNVSAYETVEVHSSMKLSHEYASICFFDFSKLSCENKTQRRIFKSEQAFLFISLFKMRVEIRCVPRPLFTLLLDRNLKWFTFPIAFGRRCSQHYMSKCSQSAEGQSRHPLVRITTRR